MHGNITLYMGPMHGCKSTRLLADYERAWVGKKKIMLIKPKIDNRYSEDEVVTHSNHRQRALVVERLQQVDVKGYQQVFVDEGQFFSDLAVYANQWARQGVDVYIAALDADARQHMWDCIRDLIPYCTYITKLSAVCEGCYNHDAHLTRLVEDDGVSDLTRAVGGSGMYRSFCRSCSPV